MRQNAGGVARGIQVTRLWFDPAAGSSKGGFTDHVYSCHTGKGGSKGLNPSKLIFSLWGVTIHIGDQMHWKTLR